MKAVMAIVMATALITLAGCEPFDDGCEHESYEQQPDGSITVRGDAKDSKLDTIGGNVTVDGSIDKVQINTAAAPEEGE